MQTILFAGAGSMAEAMIHGWTKEGSTDPKNIFVMNKSDYEKLESLHDKYGVMLLEENIDTLPSIDLVILAMKPKDVRNGMKSVLPFIQDKTVILSVVAGVPMNKIEDGLGDRPIARVMPNTSATIGMSASAVAWNRNINSKQKKEILNFLGTIGTVVEVDEDALHAVTALSGSGPAYFYYFMEALEHAAMEKGLPKNIARPLIIQTLSGVAEMMKNENVEPSELRKKVTSPGGTTEAGLKALYENGFDETISKCIDRAEEKSRELGQQF